MHSPRRIGSDLSRILAFAACLSLIGCTTGGVEGTTAASRGEMIAKLRASEVDSKRAEARIQADQFDLGLRKASASSPGQPPDEATRRNAATAALAHEIKELRRKLRKNRKEQHALRTRLGPVAGTL